MHRTIIRDATFAEMQADRTADSLTAQMCRGTDYDAGLSFRRIDESAGTYRFDFAALVLCQPGADLRTETIATLEALLQNLKGGA